MGCLNSWSCTTDSSLVGSFEYKHFKASSLVAANSSLTIVVTASIAYWLDINPQVGTHPSILQGTSSFASMGSLVTVEPKLLTSILCFKASLESLLIARFSGFYWYDASLSYHGT